MNKYTPTPDEAKAPTRSRRLSRKQFDGYLHKLYGCPGNNDVTPHYVFGGDEEDDFYVEVFLNAPDGGTMIAVHHGPRLDHVDVFSFEPSPQDQNVAPENKDVAHLNPDEVDALCTTKGDLRAAKRYRDIVESSEAAMRKLTKQA